MRQFISLLLAAVFCSLCLVLSLQAKEPKSGAEITDAASLLAALGGEENAELEGENTVILFRDVLLREPLIIRGKNLTLRGAGCRISRPEGSDFPLIRLEEGGELQLGTEEGQNKDFSLEFLGGKEDSAPLMEVRGGKLRVCEGCVFRDAQCEASGGALAVHGGEVHWEGGSITDCTAQSGGALWLSGGSFYLQSGSFQRCQAEQLGGAVYQTGGTFYLLGGRIGGSYSDEATSASNANPQDGNQAQNGGGIYQAGGTLQLIQGEICCNTASEDGGGLYLAEEATLRFDGGYLLYNQAARGGGLYNFGQLLIFEDARISGNTARDCGGGVFNGNQGHASVEKGLISSNYAGEGGGGGLYNLGDWSASAGDISFNMTEGAGGGVFNRGSLRLHNSALLSNHAAIGTAILNDGTLAFTGSSHLSAKGVIALVRSSVGCAKITVDSELTWQSTDSITARLMMVLASFDGQKTEYYDAPAEGVVLIEGNYAKDAAARMTLFTEKEETWALDSEGKTVRRLHPTVKRYLTIAAVLLLCAAAALLFLLARHKSRTGSK